MTDHLATLWEANAAALGDELALQHGPRRVTWADFDDRAGRLAAGLRSLGVGAGDTVAIDLYNCPEYLETFFAALKIRAVPANVNYRYLDRELRDLLTSSDAVAVVMHASLAERTPLGPGAVPSLRAVVVVDDDGTTRGPGAAGYEELIAGHQPVMPMRRPGSDVYLSYTGGTTGLPKGVEYVVANSVRNASLHAREMLGATGFDGDVSALRRRGALPVAVPASPLMHSTGLIMAAVPALVAGGRVITLTARSFDAHELLRTVDADRATTVTIVGDAFGRPILRALDEASASHTPYDGSSLVTIASAGVMWSKEVKVGLLRHLPGVALVDACGSSEGGTIGTRVTRAGDEASGDRFDPAPAIRILDELDRPIPLGDTTPGTFLVPTVARGYRNDSAATARAFVTIDGQRFVRPGDWGHWNPDGTVTLIGRGSSTVNTGGEKVFPEEVQKQILLLDGIDDCVVLGVPDDRLGQRLAAIVQCSPGSLRTAEEIQEWLRSRVAGYKVPRVVVLAEVPRAPNGKIRFDTAAAVVSDSPSPGTTPGN